MLSHMVRAVFTNRIDDMQLQDLAQMDAREMVHQVQEFFGDFTVLDTHHFCIPISKPQVVMQPFSWEFANRHAVSTPVIPMCSPAVLALVMVHYEIRVYCQGTSRAHAEVLKNFVVWRPLQPAADRSRACAAMLHDVKGPEGRETSIAQCILATMCVPQPKLICLGSFQKPLGEESWVPACSNVTGNVPCLCLAPSPWKRLRRPIR